MRNTISAKFPNSFLFSAACFLMLCPLAFINAQSRSASINLEGEWQERTLSQVNIDGSTTNLYSSFTFDGQGKVVQTILISKGIGVTMTNSPFGNITLPSARTLVGTYKISGKSISIDLPDRSMEATISDNTMKGILTAKSNGQKEEWFVGNLASKNNSSNSTKDSEQRNYSNSPSGNKYSAPVDSPIIGTWKYEDGCTTTEVFGFKATSCNRVSTYAYSQDGNVHSFHIINLSTQTADGNWKYTAEDKSLGVLEEFKDSKLVEKGNVKFLGKSQLQYTITFSVSADIVGKTYIWNKQ